MKTTLLILISTCLGLLAQTPSSVGGGADPVPREAATNTVDFSGLDLNVFLDVYASLAGRTVLHATSLQSAPIKLKTEKPLTRTELLAAMQGALENNGITVINQGSHLARAVFLDQATANSNAVAAIVRPPASPEDLATNNADFPDLDPGTFLGVYGALVGRTIQNPAEVQAAPITLKTAKPLTHPELVEAMQTVLELNGIAVTNVGNNFVRAVMIK